MANENGGSAAATWKVTGNEDLLREILLRLPVSSLLKFKSVSKQWLNLISDPQFTHDHTSRTNPRCLFPSALFFYKPISESFPSVNFVWLDNVPNQSSGVRVPSLSFLESDAKGAPIRIRHSCNGLILCEIFIELRSSDLNLCVCNPTTKTYTMLPKPNITQSHTIFGISLAFDPWESHHYRVVFVKRGGRDLSVDIYSSESGLWATSICSNNLPIKHLKTGSGVYWNGGIHWISDYNFKCYSLEFSIRTNNFTLTELPRNPSRSKIRYFGEFSGRLYLIYINNRLAEEFEVLAKDRDTSEWFPRYRVDMNRIDCRRRKDYPFKIMCVVDRGEEGEDSELVVIVPGKIISYNFKRKMSKLLCEVPWKEIRIEEIFSWSDFNFHSFFPYIESLASV